jgi:hypothetical protein
MTHSKKHHHESLVRKSSHSRRLTTTRTRLVLEWLEARTLSCAEASRAKLSSALAPAHDSFKPLLHRPAPHPDALCAEAQPTVLLDDRVFGKARDGLTKHDHFW